MGFPCLILNTDQHGQNTEFFSIKYGSPNIDLNHLGNIRNRIFGVWRSALMDYHNGCDKESDIEFNV